MVVAANDLVLHKRLWTRRLTHLKTSKFFRESSMTNGSCSWVAGRVFHRDWLRRLLCPIYWTWFAGGLGQAPTSSNSNVSTAIGSCDMTFIRTRNLGIRLSIKVAHIWHKNKQFMETTFRKKGLDLSQVDLWCMPVTPGLGRLRQEGLELEASLGYIVRPCLKTSKQPNQSSMALLVTPPPIRSAGILDSNLPGTALIPLPLPCNPQWQGPLSSWYSFEKEQISGEFFGFQKLHIKEFYQFQKCKDKNLWMSYNILKRGAPP